LCGIVLQMVRNFIKKLSNRMVISFVVCLIVFLLYFVLLPSDYTDANNGADGGDLLAAILTDGIPHPTGYPTYLIFGKLFQLIPLGTPYYRGALLSLLFSSLTAGLISYYFCFARNDENNAAVGAIAAFAVGISFGTSPSVWSQGVIVEVYGLESFFMVCAIFWLKLILRGDVSGRNDIGLTFLSLVIGLGIGNHVMILLMVPLALFAYYSAYKKGVNIWKLLKYSCLVITSAVVVYTTLPIRARQFPPINWGNPQNMKNFIWLISGQLYHGLAFGLPTADILPRIGAYAKFLLEQFGILGFFIGILGAAKTDATGKMKWAYFWIIFIYSIFSILYLTNDSMVYLIPALIVFSIWIGEGLMDLWKGLEINPFLGKVLVALFFILLLIRIPGIIEEIDPREDNAARLYAEQCLNILPQDAILLTEEDPDTFPIWYYHFGLGQRADIRVIVTLALQGFLSHYSLVELFRFQLQEFALQQ